MFCEILTSYREVGWDFQECVSSGKTSNSHELFCIYAEASRMLLSVSEACVIPSVSHHLGLLDGRPRIGILGECDVWLIAMQLIRIPQAPDEIRHPSWQRGSDNHSESCFRVYTLQNSATDRPMNHSVDWPATMNLSKILSSCSAVGSGMVVELWFGGKWLQGQCQHARNWCEV
jgi:hypothetical protein